MKKINLNDFHKYFKNKSIRYDGHNYDTYVLLGNVRSIKNRLSMNIKQSETEALNVELNELSTFIKQNWDKFIIKWEENYG